MKTIPAHTQREIYVYIHIDIYICTNISFSVLICANRHRPPSKFVQVAFETASSISRMMKGIAKGISASRRFMHPVSNDWCLSPIHKTSKIQTRFAIPIWVRPSHEARTPGLKGLGLGSLIPSGKLYRHVDIQERLRNPFESPCHVDGCR